MNPLNFLRALWPDKPDELLVLVWTHPDKRSRWFRTVEEAAAAIETLKTQGVEIYTGVGLSKVDYGPAQRCQSEQIAGIAGFWGDFDLASKAHGNKPLPATIDQALSVIPASLQPTVVVATGNGAHAWWLFKEPLIFDDDEERARAGRGIARWHTYLKMVASQHGWVFDRLSDLARVLRVPGTSNLKDPKQPKPVKTIAHTPYRFNLSDFEEFLDDAQIPDPETEEKTARQWAERFKDKELVVNLGARIPDDVLKAWLDLDMRFRNTWGRQRHDLKDQSQSGYDLALADFGVQAGLSEQQIVDLLIHHRAIHGQKQRMRVEYYQRTIAKAWNRSGLDGRPAAGELAPDNAKTAPQAPAAEPATDKPLTVTEKAQLCAKLSAALGVRIVRMVKIAGKDPTYHMELEQGGRIEFPSVKALFSQETAKLLIAATINRRIRKFKQKQWDEIVDDLLLACIEVEADEENSLEGASRLRVATYLNDTAFIDNLEGKAGQEARRPMIVNGRITICSGDLQQHASKTSGSAITVRQIASELGAIGATRTRVVGWPSKREQLRWVLPLSEFDPSEFMKGEPANAADE